MRRLSNICVGVLANDRQLFAATDAALLLRTSDTARRQPFRAGCLAKPMTATLLAAAVAEGKTTWTASVNGILGVTGVGERALTRVDMRQLLNHTHGLDASVVDAVPRTGDGRIDAQTLCDLLAPTPISAPGRLYSYSDVGSWLAGAVLEKIYSRSYKRLLSDTLFQGCSPDSTVRGDNVICPATGEDLSLTAQDWLLFLEPHLRSDPDDDPRKRQAGLHDLQTDQTLLPGWSPAEHASCLGWKSYGGGWFGHNSNSTDSSSLLRFNPDKRVAMVVSAPGEAAFAALATIFGPVFPEFYTFDVPRLLKPGECEPLDHRRYAGRYVQAGSSIEIALLSPTVLSYTLHGAKWDETRTACTLRAAAGNVFIPQSTHEFAFLQFVRPGADSSFDYLWDGQQLWRRDKFETVAQSQMKW